MAEVTWVLLCELAAIGALTLMLGVWVAARALLRRVRTTRRSRSRRRAVHGRGWTVAELRERERAEGLRYYPTSGGPREGRQAARFRHGT